MLLRWFFLLIVALITKAATNTTEKNLCDLSSHCSNNSLSLPTERSNELRCKNTTSCFPWDENSQYAVNKMNKTYIHLKDVSVQQKKDGHQVEIKLGLYNNAIKEGNQSLLVKFSFGAESTCHQFLIPPSILIESEDILLSCLTNPVLPGELYLYLIHKDTDEVISVQALYYPLNNVTVVQRLGGNPFRITHDLDDEFIYFSLNATQDLKCLFSYSISIYKSDDKYSCSTNQTEEYSWYDTLDSPYHRLNMRKKDLSFGQKYCVNAVFSKLQQCRMLQAEYLHSISFFQLLPPFCIDWNFTIAVKSNKPFGREVAEGTKSPGSVIRKDLIVTFTFWEKYLSCFGSYCMYLYEFDWPSCDPDYGSVVPGSLKYGATPNGTVVFNSPVCEDGGHQLLLGGLNFEERHNQTTVVFKDIAIGYYCILVIPILVNGSVREDWSRDSKAILVTENGVSIITEWNKTIENTVFGTTEIIALSLLLLFTAIVMIMLLWSCSVHIRKSKATAKKPFSTNNEEKESLPLLIQPVDRVYLFYSNDDNSIKSDVIRLETFLTKAAPFSIITLNDDVLLDIWEKRANTISNILECGCSGNGQPCASRKRFIIVISEQVLRHRTSKDGQSILKSIKDEVFHKVFDAISADWEKAYCHLFFVAFDESIFEDRRFKMIAPENIPGAYYTIPNDLTRLCTKLGFSSSRDMWGDELLVCPEP